jgi:rubrerythrin
VYNPLKLISALFPQKQDIIKCKKCGFSFSKKEVPISGWEDHLHGFHRHCPKCNSTAESFISKF